MYIYIYISNSLYPFQWLHFFISRQSKVATVLVAGLTTGISTSAATIASARYPKLEGAGFPCF